MEDSSLGVIKERVACSAENVTVLGLDINFMGFYALRWVFYHSGGFLCVVLVWVFSVPCYFGVCRDGQGMCFLPATGKCLVSPEGGPKVC